MGCERAVYTIGVAERTVTPATGVRLQGHLNRSGPAGAILDDLFLRVLVLWSDGSAALGSIGFVLVHCDVLALDAVTASEIKSSLRERFSITVDCTVVAASHTHTAPPVIRLGSIEPDQEFRHLLLHRIDAAVAAALARPQQTYLTCGAR